jgi:hypothetical protein
MSQTATKSDLKKLESRMNFKFTGIDSRINQLDMKLDTKTGLLAEAIFKMDQRLTNVENTMATKNDIQRVLDHIDAFAGQIQDYSRKAVVHDYRFNQLEPQVEDHEKRISFLEKKRDSH